jgi:hypothetical protein
MTNEQKQGRSILICAMLCVTTLEIVAMLLHEDGKFFLTVLCLVGSLAGGGAITKFWPNSLRIKK